MKENEFMIELLAELEKSKSKSKINKDISYIKNNKDIAKFETIEEANKKAKYLNDKYNYEISDKNYSSIFNYKYRELSPELSDLEKYLASESLYNKIYCNYTKDKENEKYKQVYFVQECVL